MAELESILTAFCADASLNFQTAHSAVWNMCCNRQTATVCQLLQKAIAQIHALPADRDQEAYLLRLRDIAMAYSNVCLARGYPTISTMIETFRTKRDDFSTPPPSP